MQTAHDVDAFASVDGYSVWSDHTALLTQVKATYAMTLVVANDPFGLQSTPSVVVWRSRDRATANEFATTQGIGQVLVDLY